MVKIARRDVSVSMAARVTLSMARVTVSQAGEERPVASGVVSRSRCTENTATESALVIRTTPRCKLITMRDRE